MTRKEIKELLPILQAFAEGKTLECSFNDEPWAETNNLLFCDGSKYRIKSDKSEPKYRPFKTYEECWNEMLKHQPFGWTKLIGETGYSFIGDVDDEVIYSDAFKECTFADGTPFGIKE